MTDRILIIFLWFLTSTIIGVKAENPRSQHYRPDGISVITTDGNYRYNRALYGARTGFRVDCSDRTEFGIYLPRMGGNLLLTLPEGECTARYTPGRMDYSQGGVEVEVQVGREEDMALWRVSNCNEAEVRIPVRFGGVADKRFHRDGDLGVDPPDCFSLRPEYCEGNIYKVDGDSVRVSYGKEHSKILTLILPTASHTITELPSYEGVIHLGPGESKVLALFPGENIPLMPIDSLISRAEERRKRLASRMEFETPDTMLNPIAGALSVAADAILGEKTWLHGAVGWRTPHLGWRGCYTGDAIGDHGSALTHFRTYAENQVTDVPPIYPQPCQDSTLNLARAEKKWGTPFYSNGYICRRPGKKDEMSHYDMNIIYADALLRHFRHTGDTEAMRELFPVIKRHLEWEKRNFDPDDDGLYDAYCCIWASDALYYSGGDVTHSTAYNLFANRLAAQVAERIGEDPIHWSKEAEKISEALDSVLWITERGHWAEYRDRAGHRRLHPSAALWSIYHAIDSETADPFRAYAATCYIDSAIPHIPVKGEGIPEGLELLSSTCWQPYSWSINNVAIAENIHTALAYWEAGRNEEAFKLMKAVAADNMYLGASPLNFGQLSHYDAARGECYRDFADAIGIWSRALTEGLFGIRPDLLAENPVIHITPGFPAEWEQATINLPDISYSYQREGEKSIYTINNRYGHDSEVILTIPAGGRAKVKVNGKPVTPEVPVSIGTPRITVHAGIAPALTVEISEDKVETPSRPTGRERHEGPVKFREMTDGGLRWWEVSVTPGAYRFPTPETNNFHDVKPELCSTIDLSDYYNASVTDIYNNRYLSPRPDVTTLQIPVQGIGEWCHPTLTAEIDDTGLREMIQATSDGIIRSGSVPFKLPAEGKNISFTTLWDNYPDSVTVALQGYATHLYLLMAGSTNHMQYGIENGLLKIKYKDGSVEETPLVNPVNWVPIEQDYYHDDHAFAPVAGTRPPMRMMLSDGRVTRHPIEPASDKGPAERYIKGGAAVVLDVETDPTRELESLILKTLSGDVVIGLMGVTIQNAP